MREAWVCMHVCVTTCAYMCVCGGEPGDQGPCIELAVHQLDYIMHTT